MQYWHFDNVSQLVDDTHRGMLSAHGHRARETLPIKQEFAALTAYDGATRRIATVAISSRWSLPGPCPVAIFVTATPVPVST